MFIRMNYKNKILQKSFSQILVGGGGQTAGTRVCTGDEYLKKYTEYKRDVIYQCLYIYLR